MAEEVLESEAPQAADKAKPERREIKGGLPYTTSPGVLKKALEGIIAAERPDKFSADFMSAILKLTGGSARTVPPLLKKMEFIQADGSPTALYSAFRTEAGRSQAAFAGLKNAYSELFKRNEYVHKLDETGIKDIIVDITGLKKSDPITRYIYLTFDSIKSFISGDVQTERAVIDESSEEDVGTRAGRSETGFGRSAYSNQIGLSYQINIVLPETDNIAVFNAIFRSLRENLLS